MINERKLREEICEIGRRLYNKGFAAANDGNITVRLNEREVLCTPTMVSKGFMKPEDICKVDYEGKQLAGTRKRTSEVLLHLAVYKTRPDVNAVVHCHPPHATAFAVAQEPIPKCILPEVEVFLGEVPMARYETPGTAYFNSEIIDAYCRILILARQLGRVNYFTEGQTQELLDIKKHLGYDDPRFRCENCDLCGNSIFDRGYSEFAPQPQAFDREQENGHANGAESHDLEKIVQTVTNQVMAALTNI